MDVGALIKERIDTKRLFHSYIVSGLNSDGRLEAAKYIAQAAVCSSPGERPCGYCDHCRKAKKGVHPDISVVERGSGRELTVDAVRSIRLSAAVVPNEAEKSVYIICDGDMMNLSAQNAMLKILEEPPSYGLFIILAENTGRLISTVRSRCELISLPPSDVFSPNPIGEKMMSAIEQNDRVGIVSGAVELEKLSRPELEDAITTMRRSGVELLAEGRISSNFGEKILAAFDDCEKYMEANVSAGHVVSRLLGAIFG